MIFKSTFLVFFIALVIPSFAWEVVGERISPGAQPLFSLSETETTLFKTFSFIQENGTIAVSGPEAKAIEQEVRTLVLEQEANRSSAETTTTFVQRGPAITDVGTTQRIGEFVPEDGPSFAAPPTYDSSVETSDNGNPFDRVDLRVGNAGKVFDAVKPLGGLPLPIATVSNKPAGAAYAGVQLNPDLPGAPLGAGSEGSTFGKMRSDQSFSNLIQKDASTQETEESKLAKDLEDLKKDEKNKKDKKSPEQLKADMDRIKNLQPAYNFEQYKEVRQLLYENRSIKASSNSDFTKKADEIFRDQQKFDVGEDSQEQKQVYSDFVHPQKEPLFPATPQEPANRLGNNPNHRE